MVRVGHGRMLAAILCFAASLLGISRATLADAPPMVPYLDYSSFSSSGRSLRIAPVEVRAEAYGKGSAWSGETTRLQAHVFEKALIETIEKSGLFRYVSDNGNATLELRTRILGHRILPGATLTSLLFVRYDLVDTATERSLWNENLLVQYHGYGGSQEYANSAAARKSLTLLLERLAQWAQREARPVRPD